MRFWLVNVVALATVVTAAVVHGLWSYRWRTFDRAAVTATLDRVPLEFGDWKGVEAAEDDISTWRDEMDLGQVRRYTHRVTGVNVLLMLRGGPPGPIGRDHTPASCYNAVGFANRGGDVARPYQDAAGGANTLWVSAYEKPGAVPQRVRVYWGYTGGAGWAAPTNARLELAGFGVCYKMYVVRNLASLDEPLDGDACEAFLRDALPAINAALFPPAPKG